MGRGWKRPPQDGASFALGPLLALRQSILIQRGRRPAASGFPAARAGRVHQPHTLSRNHSPYGLGASGSIGLAPWRLGVAPFDRSTVARRLQSARTRGRSRRPGCHRRWRLVMRHSRRATRTDRPTHDRHTPPRPFVALLLVNQAAGRPHAARQHDQRFRCTDARRIRIVFGTAARPRAKRNVRQATQLN